MINNAVFLSIYRGKKKNEMDLKVIVGGGGVIN